VQGSETSRGACPRPARRRRAVRCRTAVSSRRRTGHRPSARPPRSRGWSSRSWSPSPTVERRRDLLATCAALGPADRDDSVALIELTLRALARRIAELDEELANLNARRCIPTWIAPALCAAQGMGPDTASGLLLAAGDHPDRLRSECFWSALQVASPIEVVFRQDRPSLAQPRRQRPRQRHLVGIVIVCMKATQPRTTTSNDAPKRDCPDRDRVLPQALAHCPARYEPGQLPWRLALELLLRARRRPAIMSRRLYR